MWPRFRLTPEEEVFNSKYEMPGKAVMPVLRRIYPGELNLTNTINEDSETLQISRRVRIVALTGSGDIHAIKVNIRDIAGEEYTPGEYSPLSELLLGQTTFDTRSNELYNPLINIVGPPYGILTGFIGGFATYAPYIFEPNIVMAPNQTITVNARRINPENTDPLHVDLCFHVVEFPGFQGSL